MEDYLNPLLTQLDVSFTRYSAASHLIIPICLLQRLDKSHLGFSALGRNCPYLQVHIEHCRKIFSNVCWSSSEFLSFLCLPYKGQNHILCVPFLFYTSPVPFASLRPKDASLPVPSSTKTKDKDEKGSTGKTKTCWVSASLSLWHAEGPCQSLKSVKNMLWFLSIPSAGFYWILQLSHLKAMSLLYSWITVLHFDLQTPLRQTSYSVN